MRLARRKLKLLAFVFFFASTDGLHKYCTVLPSTAYIWFKSCLKRSLFFLSLLQSTLRPNVSFLLFQGISRDPKVTWNISIHSGMDGMLSSLKEAKITIESRRYVVRIFIRSCTCFRINSLVRRIQTNKQTKGNFQDLVNSKEDILYSLLASESSVENWRSQQTKSRKRKILTMSGPL